jgi:uncharacterized integral membrane protein
VALGYLLVAIVAAAVAVFALQNSAPTRVQFAVWSIDGVPVAAVVLLALAAGLVVAGVPLLIQRWRLRARVRGLEARLATLERETTAARVPPAAEPRPRAYGE